jgi:hypothetical protein
MLGARDAQSRKSAVLHVVLQPAGGRFGGWMEQRAHGFDV